jgi:hypothetical protein
VTIRHSCAVCRKEIPLSAYVVRITPDRKLQFTVECHGRLCIITRAIYPDMEGILFSDLPAVAIVDRRPAAWIEDPEPDEPISDSRMTA